ncbi:MAG: hypothetical protein JJ902_02250 [Roseibium sp.]|nr:hypothetical protein [Roseibium sp.]
MSGLQMTVGWAWATIGALLYAGQLVSTISFPLAQRLGLQEKAANADPLVGRLERMAARWDLAVLWLPPIAGVLMLSDHALWRPVCLIAGGVYLDAGGREWSKVAGLSRHGIPIGSDKERVIIYATFGFFVLSGLAGLAVGLAA